MNNRYNKTERTLRLFKELLEKNELRLRDDLDDIAEAINLRPSIQKESKVRAIKRAMQPLFDMFNSEDDELIKFDKVENRYYINRPSETLKRFIKTSENTWLITKLATSIDSDAFEELQKETNRDENIFFFLHSEFEKIPEKKQKLFNQLTTAIEKRNYISLFYSYAKRIRFTNIKPFRIVFTDNNWYLLAVVDSDDGETVRFLRVNFIESLEISEKTFQKTSMKEFKKFLSQIQNSMTLFGKEKKEVTLEASPKIAIYFKKGRKKFLNSQKFIEELKDGSVRFSLEYTQPLEILPFIKRWLPDLKIISSPNGELQKELKKELKEALKSYED